MLPVTTIVKDYIIYNESKGRVNYQTMIKISNTCQKFSVHWFLWDGSLSYVHYIYMYVDFAIKSSTKTNEIYLIIICNSNEITCQNYSPAKKNL